LCLEAVVDKRPGTILLFVYLALAIIGAAAGTIQQTFMACCDGADAGSVAQYAMSALVADFVEIARTILHTDEKGIQSRDYRLIYI
jgi:hypothetical protein